MALGPALLLINMCVAEEVWLFHGFIWAAVIPECDINSGNQETALETGCRLYSLAGAAGTTAAAAADWLAAAGNRARLCLITSSLIQDGNGWHS